MVVSPKFFFFKYLRFPEIIFRKKNWTLRPSKASKISLQYGSKLEKFTIFRKKMSNAISKDSDPQNQKKKFLEDKKCRRKTLSEWIFAVLAQFCVKTSIVLTKNRDFLGIFA